MHESAVAYVDSPSCGSGACASFDGFSRERRLMIERQRRTKILATLGPATDPPGVLEDLFRAGVNVVRLNFSHGDPSGQAKRAAEVRAAAQRVGSEVGILARVRGDVYVALGEPLGNNAWAVRVHVKPFVRWVWLGALLMALGGFVTAADRRFRRFQE
jgi:hypothetical protein